MDENKFWTVISAIGAIVVIYIATLIMMYNLNSLKMAIENNYCQKTIVGINYPVWQKCDSNERDKK